MERKILVAVDDSPRSHNSLQYISLLFADSPDVHFHLFSSAVCQSLPLEKKWMDDDEFFNSLTPEDRNLLQSTNYHIRESAAQLKRLGISENRITTNVHSTNAGAARDIIFEACQGYYDALLLCRRGMSKIEEAIIGSVSTRVLDSCHSIPIWILDGQVTSQKILLAVDGSTYSLRAADHLAFIMKNNPHAAITLFHCPTLFPQKKTFAVENFYAEWDRKWCDEHLTREDRLFHGPEQLLLESGIHPENISRLHVGDIDPSRQILRQASLENYGTIVIGRRSSLEKKGLFGGVTDRIMLMAEDVAVWIVG